MFCYQCEQTAGGKGCTVKGVCGKEPEIAALLDLLVLITKGVGVYAHCLRQHGVTTREADHFIVDALFTTVTNVNFDPSRIGALIQQGATLRRSLATSCAHVCQKAGCPVPALPEEVAIEPAKEIAQMVEQGQKWDIQKGIARSGADVIGLQELIMYGLKGMSAYLDHARILGKEEDRLYAFLHEVLAFLAQNPSDSNALTAMALRVGEANLKTMELLDAANTRAYGHPEPTSVVVTPRKGKCIVVSGHDLKDLKMLLEQTEGKGIHIYTHGEMLPAHAYPELKKHKHLVGNYGGAWQDQQKEFEAFPGAILMTTNCIQRPKESYKDRIFTTGLVAWPGVRHIEADATGWKDFSPVIEAALSAPGFSSDAEAQTITIGFARNTVMSVAGKVIEAVKAGAIRHFFLIGGCDGAKSGRNYYTEFAQKVPKDCVILTLACGKYRFNKFDFGEIGGIPRLLDCGQCNDAYSAIQIALALAKAFQCSVNDLPLSLILSWYEQKAVAILLTLLYLGIQNIRLGPSLPAFLTPPILQVLVEKFAIKPITTVDQDLNAILK